MKAAQLKKYGKEYSLDIEAEPTPKIQPNQVLIRVKYAAVNPLDALIGTGSLRAIKNYSLPQTMGNELTGVVEGLGSRVTEYQKGDAIYTRLPFDQIGAFAEFVAVDANAIAPLPKNLDLKHGAAAALTGLTAYQGLHEELNAKPGETLFIPGGSGSFGQMAIPIAKAMGMTVYVSGNAEAKQRTLALGADKYFDYKTENYWEDLSNIDYVIDTLGKRELEHELSIIKPGGKLLSLILGPNKRFAVGHEMPTWKRLLFSFVGRRIDRKAKLHGVAYHFIFVRSDGAQLQSLSKIIEDNNIVPAVDPTEFELNQVNEAQHFLASGHPAGKVVIDLNNVNQ